MSVLHADRTAWLTERRKRIGTSDAAAILGVSSFSSEWDVWADKRDMLNEWKGNSATKAGNAYERAVLDVAEEKLGEIERNVFIAHESLPVAATLDARVIETGIPIEAKTTGIVGPVFGDWGDEMTDQVPDSYLVQCHAQMLVTGAEMVYLFALIAGRGTVQFQIDRSDSMCDKLGNILSDWWDKHIIQGIEPSRDKASLDVVKRMRRTPSKTIELGSDIESLVAEREHCKQAIKTYSTREEQCAAKILLALGDAEGAELPNGDKITYLEQSRKGFFVQPTSFRVLRVKKAK